MLVFNYLDYRLFLKKYIQNLPKKGRGEMNKMAAHMSIHPSLLSQIISLERNLTSEQAHLLCEYLGLTILETDYFINLVHFQRAGTAQLKNYFKDKLKILKESSLNLSKNIKQDLELNDEDKSIFYSHWHYMALWLYTSIDQGKKLEDIVNHFEISRERAMNILSFLVMKGLCQLENNLYVMGSQSIHVSSTSPHVYRHHLNWRIKSIEVTDKILNEDLMYTAPMAISKSDFMHIRSEFVKMIKEISTIAVDSKAEDLFYLGIDFFKIKNKKDDRV